MNIVEYQNWTLSTAIYPEAGEGTEREFNYVALKLAGEAGEVADKFGKLIRAGVIGPSPGESLSFLSLEHRKLLVDELGDVLWYLARGCAALGIDLEQLAKINVAKLELRKAEGQLGSITRPDPAPAQ